MTRIYIWFIITATVIKTCLGANILAVFTFPGLSHYRMFQPLLKELATRGHNVDVVNHFPLKTPFKGFNDINISGSSPIFTNNMSVDTLLSSDGAEFTKLMVGPCGIDVCKNSFNTPQLQELKSSTKKYDVVLTELFGSDCMLGWAWHFGVPSIVMTSSANLPWASERFGLPDNPSYIPNYFSGYLSKMTLLERITNTIQLIQAKFIYEFYSLRPSNVIAKEFFGENLPDLNVLAYNTSLQLINTHFSVNNARPLVPNVVEVAGLHIQKSHKINEYFDKILTTDKKGVVCFTMGSVLVIETLPEEQIRALLGAFGELPYKVLWKGSREKFPKNVDIPDNIHFEPWIPQQDILCDPRVKLFVSHGGMMGTQEAVYCGIPILGIPIFADQSLNLKYAEAIGYGIMVDFQTLSKDSLLSAATKLLNDPKYSNTAKQISEEFNDRPLSAMDTAVYWVEYIIRHKGAPRLQSAAKHLAWYQYYLLDVVLIMFVIPLVLVMVLIKIIHTAVRKSVEKQKTKIH